MRNIVNLDWKEGLTPEEELKYRKHFLKTDFNHSSLTALILLLISLILIVNDYLLLGMNIQFYLVVTARVFYTIFSFLIWSYLRRSTSVRSHDLLFFIWALIGTAGLIFIGTTRDQHMITYSLSIILLIFLAYLGFHSRFLFRIIQALLLSICLFIMGILNRQFVTVSEALVLNIAVVAVNVFGIYLSYYLNTHRRKQFMAESTCIDEIGQRERKEKEISLSVARFHALFKAIPFPTYTWKHDGDDFIFADYNDTAQIISQGEVSNKIGIKADEMYKDNPEIVENMKKCFRQKSNIESEMNYKLLKTGHNLYLKVRYSFVPPDLVMIHTEDLTERKQTEIDMAFNYTILKTQQELFPDGILVVDANKKVISYNRHFLNICGIPQNVIQSLNDRDLIEFASPGILDPEGFKNKVVTIYSDTKSLSNDVIELINGRIIQRNSAPMILPDGQYLGRVWFFRDITGQRKYEKDLKDSEEKYKALFENSMDAIFLTSPDGSIEAANPAACRMLGRPESEIIKYGRNLILDRNDPRLKVALKLREETGRFKGELMYVRADGTSFPGEVTTAIFTDSNGKVRTSMIVRDITERKAAEKALKESEERYRQMVETANEGIWLATPNGETTFINQKMADMLGFKREEIIGRTGSDYLVADQKLQVPASRLILSKGNRVQGQYQFMRKDGTILWTLGSTSPLINDQGRHIGNLAMHTDISELKKTENALLASEDQLRRFSTRLSDQLEAEKKHLSSEIHDELGQILTGLKIEVDILVRKIPKKSREIASGVETLLMLIEQADLVVKRVSSNLRPVFLYDLGLVEAIKWYVRQYETRNNIQCILEIPDSLETNQDLALDLFRIIQEALTNVLRHAHAGIIRISIKQQEDELDLVIQDNGRGIKPEELASADSYGIIGMRERVRRWNGQIEFQCQAGNGTRVMVRIPPAARVK